MTRLSVPLRVPAGLLSVLAGAVACAGCASHRSYVPPPATASTANTPDDDEPASGLLEHHRYHHHGGVTLFIAMSLDTLGLPPAERAAVEKIRLDLHARVAPALAADRALASALADGLDTGSFDAPKVDAAVLQVGSAAAAVHEASSDALNGLHGVLTAPERDALVDKVQSHWAVWQRANAEESTGAESGHLAMLAADLDLTKDQTDLIRSSMGVSLKSVPHVDAKAISAQLQSFGAAFKAPQFDARSLRGLQNVNEQLAKWGAAHLACFVEAAGPVLSAEQRGMLSKRLREHAQHDPSAEAQLQVAP